MLTFARPQRDGLKPLRRQGRLLTVETPLDADAMLRQLITEGEACVLAVSGQTPTMIACRSATGEPLVWRSYWRVDAEGAS
jgi:non-ribosomal peptide synthetase component F